MDAFGNQIDIGGGAVKISIEPVDDVQLEGKSLPKIRGASQMKMINSVATFDKICLAEGVKPHPLFFFFNLPLRSPLTYINYLPFSLFLHSLLQRLASRGSTISAFR